MAEQSFPIVEQPMSADQWRSVTLGIGNGILDQGGFPYRLKNLDNATNTGVLQAAQVERKPGSQAIVEGFYHRLDEDITLSFPAVTKRTTYYVVLQYDPLRTGAPVQAKVVTSLDYSQGKNYLHLYNVTREPNQLLTDAQTRMIRPRITTTSTYAYEADLPQASKVLWGSVAFIHGGRANDDAKIVMSMNDSDDNWFWKTIYDPADDRFIWSERPDTGTYTHPGHGFRRAIGRKGKTRRLRGRVSLRSGNAFQAGGEYNIFSGDIAAEDTPRESQRFIVACGNASATFAHVTVNANGAVTAYTSKNTYWIGLDGVEWEAA